MVDFTANVNRAVGGTGTLPHSHDKGLGRAIRLIAGQFVFNQAYPRVRKNVGNIEFSSLPFGLEALLRLFLDLLHLLEHFLALLIGERFIVRRELEVGRNLDQRGGVIGLNDANRPVTGLRAPEDARQSVIVLGGDRVELVIVTAGTSDGQPLKSLECSVDLFIDDVHLKLKRYPFVDRLGADGEKPGGDLMIGFLPFIAGR